VSRRSDAAGRIATGRFDFDHVRTEVAKHLGRVRTKQNTRQIDNADAR
jgi:hypothetical protein